MNRLNWILAVILGLELIFAAAVCKAGQPRRQDHIDQTADPCPVNETWVPLEEPVTYDKTSPPKPVDTIRFWRLKMNGNDHGKGDWHLFNQEDKKFLAEVSSGKWPRAAIEWANIPVLARLPK